jgi:periplasmic protein TonB
MPPPSSKDNQGLLARIASSAEYSIAAALLAVCIVVGGAFWLLRPQESGTEAAPVPAVAVATAPVVDEDAALDDWRRRLGQQFDAIEDQQRQRLAEEEETRRARQRAEDAAAEARRQAELAAQARRAAEAAARERSFLASPAPTAPAVVAATPRPTPTPVPQPSLPVVLEAAIDWSSCQRPNYPALSVNRGEEGVVVVAVDLDASARILNAEVAESSGHARLDRVTLEAVRKCRFTPASENGVAKAATAQVRMTWKLQN